MKACCSWTSAGTGTPGLTWTWYMAPSPHTSPPPVGGTQLEQQPPGVHSHPAVRQRAARCPRGASSLWRALRTTLNPGPLLSRSVLVLVHCAPGPGSLCPGCPMLELTNDAGLGFHLAPIRWGAGRQQTEQSRAEPRRAELLLSGFRLKIYTVCFYFESAVLPLPVWTRNKRWWIPYLFWITGYKHKGRRFICRPLCTCRTFIILILITFHCPRYNTVHH